MIAISTIRLSDVNSGRTNGPRSTSFFENICVTIENPARRLAGSEHEKGVLLIVAATLAWSASGVYSRLLTTDVWTAIAWRSLFGGLFLLIPCLFLEGVFHGSNGVPSSIRPALR